MNYYEIGQRIRKFRKAQDLSQEELAEKVGISTTHMSHIETGNTKLSLQVISTIAKTLNCRVDELLYDKDPSLKSIASDSILFLLSSCTPEELLIIEDVIKTLCVSLKKYC